jgi:hypothetical protein
MANDPDRSDPYRVNFDLDLAEIPPGSYLAKVTDLRLATGPSGYAYYDVAFVVQEPREHSGRHINTILSFAPRSLRWTVKRLEAIAGRELPPTSVDLLDDDFRAQFIARLVVLRISSRPDRFGMPQAEVDAIYEVPQGASLQDVGVKEEGK